MSLVLQSILLYPDSCLRTSPHQQGWDTKMEKLSYGGIDVSKDRLDVVVLPEVVNECQARTSARRRLCFLLIRKEHYSRGVQSCAQAW